MKTYHVKLTQSADADPEESAVHSDFCGRVLWRRSGPGEYVGILSGAFPEGKTFFSQPVRDNSGDVTTGSASVFTIDREGDGAIRLNCYGTPEDGSLQRRDIDGAVFVSVTVFD